MIFVPGSITAFFSPEIHENPLKSGSVGVGITIDRGVRVSYREEGIRVNEEEWNFPTVKYVIERLGGGGVDISMELPVGCGFGMSGASALAAAFEIASARNLNAPFSKLADLAHEAEVVNRTGLGDVVTQSHGGVVARLSSGCPSLARVERFLWRAELEFLVMGELDTSTILESSLTRIQKEGKTCLKEFIKNPKLLNLFTLSKKFAEETGLMDDDVRDVVEAVEAAGGIASMVMLGKTVFAQKGLEALKEFGEPFTAKIDHCGVRIY
jgi:pantoate kinase